MVNWQDLDFRTKLLIASIGVFLGAAVASLYDVPGTNLVAGTAILAWIGNILTWPRD